MFLPFLAIALVLGGCSNLPFMQPSLEDQLVGDWEAVACQLNLKTEDGDAKSRIIDVSEGEWESRVNRTPPQMSYYEDHRYTSAYIALIDQSGRQVRDSVKQNGTWRIMGDTLEIREPSLSVPLSYFTMKFEGDRLELNSLMDIDGDGDKDDHYWMLMRRRKR